VTAHDTNAERQVLGACLALEFADAHRQAAELLTTRDFYDPRHQLIWDAITALHGENAPVDPVLVADKLGKDLTRAGGPVYLADLYGSVVVASAVAHHAQLVADAATLRRCELAGRRIAQRAEEGQADPADLVAWAAEQVAGVRDERVGVDVLTRDYATFLAAQPEQRAMVIPGLLGEGDRLILTGSGGLGKSVMLHQVAVCAAAGLQPFDFAWGDPYQPVVVTMLDFENPDHRLKNRLWPMVKDCLKYGGDPRPNLRVGGGGNPLNMLDSRAALSLLRTIEHDKPKLVYVGPVYKMHNDDPDKESVIKKVTDVLDSIRAMGVAIITEAHHTKAGGWRMGRGSCVAAILSGGGLIVMRRRGRMRWSRRGSRG
jgi:replicative DNA helicase